MFISKPNAHEKFLKFHTEINIFEMLHVLYFQGLEYTLEKS